MTKEQAQILQKKQENDYKRYIEKFSKHVVEQELGSREAEAVYKKYHFTIEADKLVKEYNAVMLKNQQLVKEHQEKQEAEREKQLVELEKFKEQAILNASLSQKPISE